MFIRLYCENFDGKIRVGPRVKKVKLWEELRVKIVKTATLKKDTEACHLFDLEQIGGATEDVMNTFYSIIMWHTI